MSTFTTEFCLFVSTELSNKGISNYGFQQLVAKKLESCLTTASNEVKNQIEDSEDRNSMLCATSCCSHGKEADCHGHHFLLVKVTSNFLKEFVDYKAPGLMEDQLSPTDMSYAQLTWLSELVLRTFPLHQTAFHELLELTNKYEVYTKSINSTTDKADLFTLQQLGIVSSLVPRHEKQERRSVWNQNFHKFKIFPDSDALRWYLGDSVGFYFAWMRTYTLFLIGPFFLALLRLVVTSILTLLSSENESLSTSTNKLSASFGILCVDSAYSLMMIIWALLCTKLWSRQHATLIEKWSTHPILERITNDMAWLFTELDQRPQYQGDWCRDIVTGNMVLHFPARKRRLRYLVSIAVIGVCLLVAGFVHVVLMNLEGYIRPDDSNKLYFGSIGQFAEKDGLFDPNYNGICSYIPGVLHSLLVYLMNQVIFRKIAEVLTDFENHQGREEHDRATVIKRFLFELVDAYGCIAYLGFVLHDRSAVTSFILTALVTDSIRRLTLECLLPLVVYRIRVWSERGKLGLLKRVADDYSADYPTDLKVERELYAESYEQFDDYLEMALQHGYLVLFAFVCPIIGPMLALIATFLEAHFDAFKMLVVTQRPSPRPLVRSQSIWLALFAAQAWLSILTNVGFFCINLAQLQSPVDYTQHDNNSTSIVYLLLEHGLVLLGLVLHFCIADEPKHVRDARRARNLRGRRRHSLWTSIPNVLPIPTRHPKIA